MTVVKSKAPVKNAGGVKSKSQPVNAKKGGKKQIVHPKTALRTKAESQAGVDVSKSFRTAASLEGKFEDIDTLGNIVKKAMKGVNVQIFYTFAHTVDIADKYLAEILNMSPRTLSNYKEQNKPLEPVKGEHLLKLIALFKKGEEIFGTLSEFGSWLSKPKMGSDKAPIFWLVTPGGVDLVSQELDRIAHGYAV